MLFNSLPFLLFLPIVVLGYFLLPQRWRWLFMLMASYFFYGYWKVEYLALIAFSTAVDYSAALWMTSTSLSLSRKIALASSLIVNLGLLFLFKYTHWFLDEVAMPAGLIDGWRIDEWKQHLNYVLPVGISFYTFQTMSYSLDVYFGKATPERNPFKFALFVSFFPQLVAGPIERFTHLHRQLFAPSKLSYTNVRAGLQLILVGFFVKMCVADNLAPLVDNVFTEVPGQSRGNLILALLAFALQIFSDFHGYSLIAIGSARIFGIGLMDNFKSPYSALSIAEFWSRWHISLSTWFRDYLYIPMGGNRSGLTRFAFNILLVFALSGLWHGANWTYVVWGLLHAGAYLFERFALNKIESKNRIIQTGRWVFTVGVVCIAWIFFRSPSIGFATTYIQSMFNSEASGQLIDFDPILVSMCGLFLIADFYTRDEGIASWLNRQSGLIRWSVYAFLTYCILAFSGTTNHPFIYFQF